MRRRSTADRIPGGFAFSHREYALNEAGIGQNTILPGNAVHFSGTA